MSPVNVTNAAWEQIKSLTPNGELLLIGLKKGGCAGMEYSMDIVEDAGPHDIIIEGEASKVAIEARAQMFLFGMEIDYQHGLLESGFQFKNPNVSDACGCGQSVNFDFEVARQS